MKIKQTTGYKTSVHPTRKAYLIEADNSEAIKVHPVGAKGWQVQGTPVKSVKEAKERFLRGEFRQTKPDEPEPAVSPGIKPDEAEPTFRSVCPACLYAVQLIGSMEGTLDPLEKAMFDDAGLIMEDGSINFEYARKEVDRARVRLAQAD